jgi:hypothetical protein
MVVKSHLHSFSDVHKSSVGHRNSLATAWEVCIYVSRSTNSSTGIMFKKNNKPAHIYTSCIVYTIYFFLFRIIHKIKIKYEGENKIL